MYGGKSYTVKLSLGWYLRMIVHIVQNKKASISALCFFAIIVIDWTEEAAKPNFMFLPTYSDIQPIQLNNLSNKDQLCSARGKHFPFKNQDGLKPANMRHLDLCCLSVVGRWVLQLFSVLSHRAREPLLLFLAVKSILLSSHTRYLKRIWKLRLPSWFLYYRLRCAAFAAVPALNSGCCCKWNLLVFHNW